MKEGKMESKEMSRNEAYNKFKELKKRFDAEIKNLGIEVKEQMPVLKEFHSVEHFLKLPGWTEAIGYLEKAEQKINALLEKIKEQALASKELEREMREIEEKTEIAKNKQDGEKKSKIPVVSEEVAALEKSAEKV